MRIKLAITVLLLCLAEGALASPHIKILTLQDSTVHIHGSFGPIVGKVLISEKETAILQWSDSLIVVKDPFLDTGSTRVIVGSDTSNPRWITKFTLVFNYTLVYCRDASIHRDETLTNVFRGDISSYLVEPDLGSVAYFDWGVVDIGESLRFDYLEPESRTSYFIPDSGRLAWDQRYAQPVRLISTCFNVTRLTSMLGIQNLPPDSVRNSSHPLSHLLNTEPTTLRPLAPYLAPELDYVFAWKMLDSMTSTHIQIYHDRLSVFDTVVKADSILFRPNVQNSMFTWFVQEFGAIGATRRSPTTSFRTAPFDRKGPLVRIDTLSAIERELVFQDSGGYNRGVKRFELSFDSSMLRVSSNFVTTDSCVTRSIHFQVRQLDSSNATRLHVTAIDCGDNRSEISVDFEGHPVKFVAPHPEPKSRIQLQLSQNPVHSDVMLTLFSLLADRCIVTLNDVTGKQVSTLFAGSIVPGETRIPIATERFPNGAYDVHVRGDREQSVIRFVISR